MIRSPRRSLASLWLGAALLIGAASLAWLSSSPAFAEDDERGRLYAAAAEVFDGFLLEFAPDPLKQRGPYRVLWAQWIGLPLIMAAAWLLGLALSRLTRFIVRPIVRRTTTRWDDAVAAALGPPLTLAWTIIGTFSLLPMLGLRPGALDFVHHVLRALWFADLYWAVLRAVDVASKGLSASAIAQHGARRALMPLLTRVAKIVIVALALITLIAELGYSVTSLVAGLGIGGLAVALAAQKTLEHWMGAISIAFDQPFREGDFIRVGDVLGTVEQIGMRSTRVRTLDRTVISIPNGKLAEMQPETFAPRDRIRLACNLKLAYGATSAQVDMVLKGVEKAVREQPKLWPEGVTVVFKELSDTALVIEVMAWFATSDWTEFMQIRQGLLLEFMRVIEGAGARFAFPGQLYELPHPRERSALNESAAHSQTKAIVRST
jgi:MscS family membrane protein